MDEQRILDGLRHCGDTPERGCIDCPYFRPLHDRPGCVTDLATDALELIRILSEEKGEQHDEEHGPGHRKYLEYHPPAAPPGRKKRGR